MRISKVQVAEAIQRLAATEDGQILLAYMTAEFGYTRKSLRSHPFGIEHAEGQRSVLVALSVLLDVDPVELQELEDQKNV